MYVNIRQITLLLKPSFWEKKRFVKIVVVGTTSVVIRLADDGQLLWAEETQYKHVLNEKRRI